LRADLEESPAEDTSETLSASHGPGEAFGAEHARSYDRHAESAMGGRDRERRYLADLLRCLPGEPRTFVDLACGTGYFTEVFFETFAGIRGTGVDGSNDMLEQARARFADKGYDLTLLSERLQSLDWSSLQSPAIVFSSFALHHFSDDEKRVLFAEIFGCLEPGGTFVLFDLFRPDDPIADDLFARMAALETQRRIQDADRTGPTLDEIIARDRASKAAHGVREASVERHLGWLRESGFSSVVVAFLDGRTGGIVAFKPA
jgi:tRNA (cmo5U34)-methyltransferase